MTLTRTEFASIVREHHAAVYRSAFRLVRIDADALDVTQQVFLRVLEGKVDLSRAEDAGRVLAFLAAKAALHRLRGDRNRRRIESEGAMRQAGFSEPESSDDEREIPRFVDRLPDELRVPIVLRFSEGMTFARIAEALECSEPTAHDRVRRGLERLRFDLTKAGFASALLAGVALEDALARQPAPAPVPPGLESSLLSLAASAWGIAALWPAAAGLALVIGAGGGYLALRGERPPASPPAGTARAVVAREEAGSRGVGPQVGAALVQREDAPRGTSVPPASGDDAGGAVAPERADAVAAAGEIAGRVVDASGAGAGIAGADVRAESAERSGKISRYRAAATTDESGDFRVTVPVPIAEGQVYSLLVTHPNFAPRRSESVSVRPGEVATVDPLAVVAIAADREGEYAFHVLVTDDAGAPIEDAAVVVHRRLRIPSGGLSVAWEAGGATDAEGRVRLEGKRLGEKWLRVDARSRGFALHQGPVSVLEAGDHEHDVALAPGLEISGRVRSADGTGVPEGVSLTALAEGDLGEDWLHAEVAPEDGAFTFLGLAPGLHEIFASADGCSAFRLEGVAAGTAGLEIALKRSNDPSDRGDHKGEIHGTLRDAKTGKPVRAGWDDVDVEWLPEDVSDEELLRDVYPTLVAKMPRQVLLMGGGPPAPSADFHVTGLDAGVYAVVARVSGYAAAMAGPFRLGAREIVRDLTLELDAGEAIAGTVVGSDGAPVKDAFVFLVGDGERSRARVAEFDEAVRESAGRGSVPVWGAVKTDAAGRFSLERVPSPASLGARRLAAVHARHEPAVAAAEPGARLTLGPGR